MKRSRFTERQVAFARLPPDKEPSLPLPKPVSDTPPGSVVLFQATLGFALLIPRIGAHAGPLKSLPSWLLG